MRRRFLIVGILSLLTISSSGQIAYASKWQTRPSVGFNFPTTKLLKGQVTDYLIEYDDQSFYWQLFSLTWFYDKHWGVEFNFQGTTSTRIRSGGEKFQQFMESEYGTDYFVTASTGASNTKFDVIGGDMERGYFGLIYRLESKDFFCYPKMAIGVTSFYTDEGQVFLKQKNSNNVFVLHYDSGKGPNDYFTIAPSLTLGYKLRKRLFLSIDFLTSLYKTNITFLKTTRDLNSDITITERIEYKKIMFNIGMGAGVILVIK